MLFAKVTVVLGEGFCKVFYTAVMVVCGGCLMSVEQCKDAWDLHSAKEFT